MEQKGWFKPSQDWNREGSHRWNTGGGYEDVHDKTDHWDSNVWGVAARSRNFIVGDYVGRGPKGYQKSDERIKDEVCERLTRDPYVDASDFEVEVKDGEVTLVGTVVDRRQKRWAEDIIEAVPGVRDIHNRIRVQRQPEF
jgi:osmotically-inducible protein OsmY